MNSVEIKQFAYGLGADLCGIALADSFKEAPKGYHPRDILPECQSVIVMACRFPRESLQGNSEIYTLVRNQMAKILDKMI